MSDELKNQNGEKAGLQLASNAPQVIPSEEQRKKEEDVLGKVKKVTKKAIKELDSISTQYWEANEVGESIQGVFRGWKKITNAEDETLIAAVIKTDTKVYLAAGVQLVDTLLEVPQFSGVYIEYKGKKQRMKMYDVKIIVKV